MLLSYFALPAVESAAGADTAHREVGDRGGREKAVARALKLAPLGEDKEEGRLVIKTSRSFFIGVSWVAPWLFHYFPPT